MVKLTKKEIKEAHTLARKLEKHRDGITEPYALAIWAIKKKRNGNPSGGWFGERRRHSEVARKMTGFKIKEYPLYETPTEVIKRRIVHREENGRRYAGAYGIARKKRKWYK